ncbi:MAG: ABC transporter permease [Proteobacteria bacterium]|nr:ABC transporter permease [Pseudomonadota bacterium]MBU1452476.1 ABC transporter permease [Pseudomonadota bacterium]MBU2468284.1 ABC transporter permease [Pseudomonadota bacterium]MBU2518156.1 ABC transporter permease [Pseudomonadota bacterium]
MPSLGPTKSASRGKPVAAILLPWLLPACAFGVWGLLSLGGLVPAYFLPPPGQVLDTAVNYIFAPQGSAPYAGRFLDDAMASLGRVGGGFALAVLLGLPLGLVSGRLKFMRLFLDTFINGVRAVPGIAWLPLALVWFGIGFKTTVFLVSLAAFFPIYLGAAAGAIQVNPLFLRSGSMMGLGKTRLIFTVLIPAAMPHVIIGLRLGLGIAFAYLVLGELTGVSGGLGAVIMDARMLGRVDIIIMGILLIAVIGRVCDLGLVGGLKFFKSVRRL